MPLFPVAEMNMAINREVDRVITTHRQSYFELSAGAGRDRRASCAITRDSKTGGGSGIVQNDAVGAAIRRDAPDRNPLPPMVCSRR